MPHAARGSPSVCIARYSKEKAVIANSRACVAYIIASLCGARGSSVYDYSQAKHISISGSSGPSSVNIYDHDRVVMFPALPQVCMTTALVPIFN